MFVSRPADRYPLPKALAEPGATYWRAVALSTNTAWYVLSVQPSQDALTRTTVLIRWDADVADSLEASAVGLTSLLCMAPEGHDRWKSIPITEVWRATDPDDDDNRHVLLVCADGQERSGLFGEVRSGLVKTRLIAKVAPGHAPLPYTG